MLAIIGRLGALVQRLKNHPAYTGAIGQDLGIIAPTASVMDMAAAQPALRIEVDRGQGWQFLAVDTVPDYLDTAPLPPADQSAVWKYRAIYLVDDQPAGQWSEPASIAVMGR